MARKKTQPKTPEPPNATPPAYKRADGATWARSQLYQTQVGREFVLKTKANNEWVDRTGTDIPVDDVEVR